MTLYVESSAVLAWLLDQPGGWLAFDDLRAADLVLTSELTMIECDRALHRHVAVGRLATTTVQSLRTELADVSSAWNLTPIGADVVGRARASFPDDRIRALDAIHLASAMTARASLGDVDLLTLDDRIRTTGSLLGFRVLPA
jgi:uncharacterized protein with PIN domain